MTERNLRQLQTRGLLEPPGTRAPCVREPDLVIVISYPGAMPDLPGWVVDNRTAVECEAAPYRRLTAEQRWRLTAAACRAAARQLASRSDREKVLAFRDPLPASSIAILRRLRDDHRRR